MMFLDAEALMARRPDPTVIRADDLHGRDSVLARAGDLLDFT